MSANQSRGKTPLALAWEIAQRAPDDHPLQVANEVFKEGGSDAAFIVALMHDAVEDGYATYAEIDQLPESLAHYVRALTRDEGEPYMAYIERVCESGDLAPVVKRADAWVNLRRCRADGNTSLARRYEQALDVLNRAVVIA